jgi:adenylosuccinate synthase
MKARGSRWPADAAFSIVARY